MPLPMSRYERNAIEQGREEGRIEARLEFRKILIELIGKLLKLKFNETSHRFTLDELADVDEETLKKYILIIAKVATLDELWARLAAPA